jgi:hypothetical protein
MAQIKVEIKGLDKLNKKILAVAPALKTGIKAGTEHVKGKIATYPPSTTANKPKAYSKGAGWGNFWYQRGWGSKWALADGSWHGLKSSEQLGQRWSTKYKHGGLVGIVGNNASYAKYVQGPDEVQNKAMPGIGWKGVDTVAKEEEATVVKFVQAKVDQALGK